MLEGATLLASALDAGADVESVYVAAGTSSVSAVESVVGRAYDVGSRIFELAPGVLERVADTVTPQPLMAVVRIPPADLAQVRALDFVVVCAGLRDPGNTGAVIRCADGAGAQAVVCCDGTVDPFNPKTVRAAAGSVLHVAVVAGGDPAVVLDELAGRGLRRLGAAVRGGVAYTDADLAGPVALVLGNEAGGLPTSVGGHLDGLVTIPMHGSAESLNVSTAAAVLCFEVQRRRSNLLAVKEVP